MAAACQTSDEGSNESANGNGPALGRSGTDIQAALNAIPGARVRDVGPGGVPSIVTGNLGSIASNQLTAADVRNVLSAVAPIFRADVKSLVFRSANVDNIHDSHYRFTQVKNGRPVLGGDLTVHVRNGVAYTVNGTVRDDIKAETDAKISLDAAIAKAKGEYTTITDLAATSKGDLSYVQGIDRLDLVYDIEVTGTQADGTPTRDTVLVDAIGGKILMRIPHIHTARNREVHNLNHGTSLPGPVERIEGQEPAADETVNLNYDRLGTVHQGYFDLFGRDSFDNAGAKLISSVHYSTNYVNAFWNGTQMVYGDGDGVNASNLAHSLDVTGHELTHAVTERTSNLTYSGESGGLNESMSDIFGNVVEWFRDGKVVSANTWMVGEDCWTPATPNDALRYMDDPAKDNRSLDWYHDYTSGTDVHYSSGISNLAFYLLAQGGTHPRGKSTQQVTGIGFEKAAQIFYRANTQGIFQASTNFEQAKAGTELAAEQLGYSTDEIASVGNAWKAVGVGVPIPPPTVIDLVNNVPVPDLSGASNSKVYYALDVPAGAENLKFDITGAGSGDADIYVKFGAVPTTSSWDCRPYSSSSTESCPVATAQTGKYYVMIHGYSAYTGVTLSGAYTGGAAPGKLLINEVEYDEIGTDTGEFVEIFNGGGSPVDLAGHSLILVNGSNSTGYLTVDLSSAGSLAAGQYLVVGSSSVTVPATALRINFPGSQTNRIQNGAPDGVALVNGSTLVDALSYEGSITAANLPNVGTVSLVEGAATTAVDSNSATRSLSRVPSGNDTDNAATDWAATASVTPGAANVN